MKKSVIGIVLVLLLTGCAASVGTGYSMLDTVPANNAPIPVTQGARQVVAVGPVGVPGYIVRAATILDTTPNLANVSIADQNAAFLNTEIPRVITVDIERQLTPKGLAVISSGTGRGADYRIAVDLSEFAVTQFNTIATKGQWALYRAGNAAPLLVKDISFSTQAAGNDTAAIRSAMSRALADLSTGIVRDFERFLGTR